MSRSIKMRYIASPIAGIYLRYLDMLANALKENIWPIYGEFFNCRTLNLNFIYGILLTITGIKSFNFLREKVFRSYRIFYLFAFQSANSILTVSFSQHFFRS